LFKAAGVEVREETSMQTDDGACSRGVTLRKPHHQFILKTQTMDNIKRKKLK